LLARQARNINTVSPGHYEEFVLPLDRELGGRYPQFGIHNCNWEADLYLDALRKIPRIGYLDTGIESDLASSSATPTSCRPCSARWPQRPPQRAT
jgi:hypothetical protein